MKNLIDGLNKAFESRVRLGIMSALAVNESLNFTALKEYLAVTDGNLASHLKALEKEDFLSLTKSFIDRKPNSEYALTDTGRKAFQAHIDALEELIKSQK